MLATRAARIVVAIVAAFSIGATAGGCADGSRAPRRAAGDAFVATHRGDRGLPENTFPAFRAALDAGAEYVETDLVASKDGVLVLRHDRHLSPTTDVEERPEFAHRRTTKALKGRRVTDWWVEDFTAAELATLRATVRRAAPAGDHRIPALRDLIDFMRNEREIRRRRIGLYLEIKQPRAFQRIGLDLENLLATTLRAEGLDRANADVYVQSWDEESVRQMTAALGVPTIQLISAGSRWDADLTPSGLRRLRDQGVAGINVVDERLESDPGLIGRARVAGLAVHGWGFEPGDDYGRWISAGIDGFVTDDVSAVVAARRRPSR